MDYAATVAELAPVPNWCLAAQGDGSALSACDAASGETYRSVIYREITLHRCELITPELDPQPMILIQDFLELVFGIKVKYHASHFLHKSALLIGGFVWLHNFPTNY